MFEATFSARGIYPPDVSFSYWSAVVLDSSVRRFFRVPKGISMNYLLVVQLRFSSFDLRNHVLDHPTHAHACWRGDRSDVTVGILATNPRGRAVSFEFSHSGGLEAFSVATYPATWARSG